MSLSDHNRDMSIASGVMAALAVVYGGYLAGNWNRRQGKVIQSRCNTIYIFFQWMDWSDRDLVFLCFYLLIFQVAIDCTTLLVFFAFSCGTLAAAFFAVNFGFSFWWLLLYKVSSFVMSLCFCYKFMFKHRFTVVNFFSPVVGRHCDCDTRQRGWNISQGISRSFIRAADHQHYPTIGRTVHRGRIFLRLGET